MAKVAEGDKEDVDLAVKAAREAFDHGPWPRMSGHVSPYLPYLSISFTFSNINSCHENVHMSTTSISQSLWALEL